MSYTKITGTFQSTNHTSKIKYYIYEPQNTPKAILQISHGMCEYIERYEPFISFLTSHDILVCGNDHLGHKGSIVSKENLGFFNDKDGWKCLVQDLAKMTLLIKKEYPTIPNFLFGHSMGSFVARIYITKYSYLIQGAIICGTSGINLTAPLGLIFANTVKILKGSHHRSQFMNNLMFGNYNAKCEDPETSSDWLSRDPNIVKEYLEDDYCNFIFTISAIKDLVTMVHIVSTNYWYRLVPITLPIHLVSGDMDPLGNYGKGIKEVHLRLARHGMKDLTMKLYNDCRHELANEINKEVFFQDILEWIEERA